MYITVCQTGNFPADVWRCGRRHIFFIIRKRGIILEETLYGKDKHDERSGYYETPCRLRKRL